MQTLTNRHEISTKHRTERTQERRKLEKKKKYIFGEDAGIENSFA